MLNIVEKSLFELTVASLYVKSQHIYMFFGVKLLQDIVHRKLSKLYNFSVIRKK